MRLGSVPFLNAKPLIHSFVEGAQPCEELILDQPSRLPLLLERGLVDAILVSSIECFRNPEAVVARGVSISSNGPVKSVRLFSKVPFTEVRTLALDQSSMTSNHLAQILLAELFDVSPRSETCPPNLSDMLADHDACVLIGDNGLLEQDASLHILDLGEAWQNLTGLPFVWAVWLGGAGLTPDIERALVEAKDYGVARIQEIAKDYAHLANLSASQAEHYLTKCIDFEFTSTHENGLLTFGELLVKHEFMVSTARNLAKFSPCL